MLHSAFTVELCFAVVSGRSLTSSDYRMPEHSAISRSCRGCHSYKATKWWLWRLKCCSWRTERTTRSQPGRRVCRKACEYHARVAGTIGHPRCACISGTVGLGRFIRAACFVSCSCSQRFTNPFALSPHQPAAPIQMQLQCRRCPQRPRSSPVLVRVRDVAIFQAIGSRPVAVLRCPRPPHPR